MTPEKPNPGGTMGRDAQGWWTCNEHGLISAPDDDETAARHFELFHPELWRQASGVQVIERRADQVARQNYIERRNELARSLGYRNYYEQRQARRSGVGLAPGDVPGPRQIIETPAGRIVRTTTGRQGRQTIDRRLARLVADDAEARVTVTATVQSRSGPRVIEFEMYANDGLVDFDSAIEDAVAEVYAHGNWHGVPVSNVQVVFPA